MTHCKLQMESGIIEWTQINGNPELHNGIYDNNHTLKGSRVGTSFICLHLSSHQTILTLQCVKSTNLIDYSNQNFLFHEGTTESKFVICARPTILQRHGMTSDLKFL
jgi:hypothetical protein